LGRWVRCRPTRDRRPRRQRRARRAAPVAAVVVRGSARRLEHGAPLDVVFSYHAFPPFRSRSGAFCSTSGPASLGPADGEQRGADRRSLSYLICAGFRHGRCGDVRASARHDAHSFSDGRARFHGSRPSAPRRSLGDDQRADCRGVGRRCHPRRVQHCGRCVALSRCYVHRSVGLHQGSVSGG
jgi:hypothetical protein